MIVGKERKIRSDKKVDCKPTISINLKECIYRLSYITTTPVKDIAEELCKEGIRSKKVIEHLAPYFRRDYKYGNTYYMGDLERISLQRKRSKVPTDRITIRFSQRDYERIKRLGFALDVTPSKATALLLEYTTYNTYYINKLIKNHLKEKLNEARMNELKELIRYINKHSPYDEKISWSSLFSYLFDELKMGTSNMATKLNNWINSKKPR